MANGEWLTQLMAGLGGAFTGAGQANARIAEEQEAERKRQEQQMERERIAAQRKLAEGLFSGPIDRDRIGKFLAAGGGLQEAQLARGLMPDEPKIQRKPLIEGVGKDNRRYAFDPNTGETTFSPVEEYRAPREPRAEGPTPADIRSARTELRGAEEGYRSVLRSRPRQSQFLNPLTRLPDTTAFQQAEQSWRPESTYAAQRRQGAGEELQALLQAGGMTPAPAPTSTMVPNAAMQQQVAQQMQQKIQEIMADPTLDDMQKRQLVQQVNQRATQFLSNR